MPDGSIVPQPYPSIGACPTALGFALKVKFVMKEVLTKNSYMPISTGDSLGTYGGVLSGVFSLNVYYASASAKVLVEGAGCAYQYASTGQNASTPVGGANVLGMQEISSQTKVLVGW